MRASLQPGGQGVSEVEFSQKSKEFRIEGLRISAREKRQYSPTAAVPFERVQKSLIPSAAILSSQFDS